MGRGIQRLDQLPAEVVEVLASFDDLQQCCARACLSGPGGPAEVEKWLETYAADRSEAEISPPSTTMLSKGAPAFLAAHQPAVAFPTQHRDPLLAPVAVSVPSNRLPGGDVKSKAPVSSRSDIPQITINFVRIKPPVPCSRKESRVRSHPVT